jgi:hypothetical protein
VLGEAAQGDGVRGVTHTRYSGGVVGINDDPHSNDKDTPGGNGVFGYSTVPNASGVFGAHENGGNGVFGVGGEQGTGVFGKGGQYAGFFDGNVTVTGSLTVQSGTINGISVDLIAQLLERVQVLEGWVSVNGVSIPPRTVTPLVTAVPAGQGAYTVNGTGFTPYRTATILVTQEVPGEASLITHTWATADASGNFSANVTAECPSNHLLLFQGADSTPDPSNPGSPITSNNFPLHC